MSDLVKTLRECSRLADAVIADRDALLIDRDALRARVTELEAERDEARHALDSIGDMLIPEPNR